VLVAIERAGSHRELGVQAVEQRERGGKLAREGVDVEVVDRCVQNPQHVTYRTPVRSSRQRKSQ
jgi:hypothetical protein